MRLEQVPDLADGGYWYVVPASDDSYGAPVMRWQYGDHHLIRADRPLNIETADAPRADEIVAGIAADGRLPIADLKPFGRFW